MDILNKKAFQWLIRTKLYHLPFWVVYQLFWGLVFSRGEVFSWIGIEYIVMYTLTEGIGAYFNSYYLVPKLLRKKKYLWYVLALCGDIVFTSVLVSLGIYLIAYQIIGEWVSLQNLIYVYGSTSAFIGATFSSAATSIFVVMVLKLGKEWLKEQARNQELEREKLETELKFLRAQVNPHFLFNTINTIFFLIQSDSQKASGALSAFSDILRYQLYECNERTVSLKREVHYLDNFVALEKLRKGNGLAVSIDVSENLYGAQIAPFILMPFIENAFKHVSSQPDGKKYIHIALTQATGKLCFTVLNTKDSEGAVEPKTNTSVYYGGIGLTNVRRRLALLYPNQHQLRVEDGNDLYSVNLTLHLHEN